MNRHHGLARLVSSLRTATKEQATSGRKPHDKLGAPLRLLEQQLRELQEGFCMIADATINEAERNARECDARHDHRQERESWEARLIELDTINRAHIEHLDRKFHDINLWQQRLDSILQDVGGRISDVEQRLAQQEGLASVQAASVAELRVDKADVASLQQHCARAAADGVVSIRAELRREAAEEARQEVRSAGALLAQDIQQLANENDALRMECRELRERTAGVAAQLDHGFRDVEAHANQVAASERAFVEAMVSDLRKLTSDVAGMCGEVSSRLDSVAAETSEINSSQAGLHSTALQHSKALSTLEQLTRLLASDSSELSVNNERLDYQLGVMTTFLKEWHQMACKTTASLCCRADVACPILPPFPLQLTSAATWG